MTIHLYNDIFIYFYRLAPLQHCSWTLHTRHPRVTNFALSLIVLWKHFDLEERIFIPPSHLNIIPESGVRFVIATGERLAEKAKAQKYLKLPQGSARSLWTKLNPKKVDCGQKAGAGTGEIR